MHDLTENYIICTEPVTRAFVCLPHDFTVQRDGEDEIESGWRKNTSEVCSHTCDTAEYNEHNPRSYQSTLTALG